MGDRMTRSTTPKTMVEHGGANSPSGGCSTTTTPYRGWGGGGATPPASREVEQLADRVRRLTVHHRDPERFHIEKSEIAHELHQLARTLEKRHG